MTKQILAFLFCFKRELNPYSPLTLALTLRARTQTFTPPLPSPSAHPSAKSILKFVYFEQKGGFNELNLRLRLILVAGEDDMFRFLLLLLGLLPLRLCRLLGGVVVIGTFDKPPRPCSRRTSVCEPRGMQRKHGAALAANGNLVAGAADAQYGTGRAEEGDGNLFLAVSIYDTPPGVVNKYQVVFLGHGVTPVGSLRKGELPGHLVFARTRGHVPPDCLCAV
jgi:hypothetical protein